MVGLSYAVVLPDTGSMSIVKGVATDFAVPDKYIAEITQVSGFCVVTAPPARAVVEAFSS